MQQFHNAVMKKNNKIGTKMYDNLTSHQNVYSSFRIFWKLQNLLKKVEKLDQLGNKIVLNFE